jgi:hypothetical protein
MIESWLPSELGAYYCKVEPEEHESYWQYVGESMLRL